MIYILLFIIIKYNIVCIIHRIIILLFHNICSPFRLLFQKNLYRNKIKVFKNLFIHNSLFPQKV